MEVIVLPQCKGERPLCVFLDTNKWIDLARAHYSRPDGQEFVPALTSITSAIEANQVVVPLGHIQVFEAQKSSKEEARQRLLRFMVGVSGNHWLAPGSLICPLEVRNALRQLVGRRESASVRPTLIKQGLSHFLGPLLGKSEIADAIRSTHESVDAPDVAIATLLGLAGERNYFEEYTRSEEAGLPHLAAIRHRAQQHLTRDQAYAVNLMSILGDPQTCGILIGTVLREEGISPDELRAAWGAPSDVLAFGESIPSIHTPLALTLAEERSRNLALNDTRDLMWMSVALPYADIVVMERSWARVVSRCGLDVKYKTTILTDLRELPRALSTGGPGN